MVIDVSLLRWNSESRICRLKRDSVKKGVENSLNNVDSYKKVFQVLFFNGFSIVSDE